MNIESADILHLYGLSLKYPSNTDLLQRCSIKEIDQNDILRLKEYCSTNLEKIIIKYNELCTPHLENKICGNLNESKRLCISENINYATELKAGCATKLGKYYFLNSSYDDSLLYYKLAYGLSPMNPVYLTNLITVTLEKNYYFEAKNLLKECVEKADFYFPNYLEINSWKASCASNLASLFSDKKVLPSYEDMNSTYYSEVAYELAPNDSRYIYKLAIDYYYNNHKDEEWLLVKCINIDNNHDYVAECGYYLNILHEHIY